MRSSILQFLINKLLLKAPVSYKQVSYKKDMFITEFQPLVSYKRVSYKKKTIVKFQRGDLQFLKRLFLTKNTCIENLHTFSTKLLRKELLHSSLLGCNLVCLCFAITLCMYLSIDLSIYLSMLYDEGYFKDFHRYARKSISIIY